MTELSLAPPPQPPPPGGEGGDPGRPPLLASQNQTQTFPSALLLPLILVCLSLITLAETSTRAPAQSTTPLPVVTTPTDLRSLAEAVGGTRVAVTSLVPPGLDPEEYQPRPQDLARVAKARLIVRVGLDFDLWFDRLLAQAGAHRGENYVDASLGIATLDVRGVSIGGGHAHPHGNPHYWLDPRNAETITANIAIALSRADPQGTATYESNRIQFLTRIEEKLPQWQEKLDPLKGKA